MDLTLDGDVALVTASSSGLGKSAAEALAREGADVVINGRDEDQLAEATEEVRQGASGRVIGHQADITERSGIEGLVQRTVSEFGGVDHLVTSAGGPPRLRPLEADDEDWYDAYDLLVMSVVRAVREAAEYLHEDGGGSIVNITSGVVKESRPRNVLSSSVRMGVIGFEKTLSQDLAPEVRANAVLPGGHETPRLQRGLRRAVKEGEFEDYDAAYASRSASVPMERFGDPMELGDLVAYLCSPRSAFVNGQAIVIDGGAARSVF